MNNTSSFHLGRIRLIIFASVTVLHIIIIMTAAFHMEIAVREAEPVAGVMRLVDVQEEIKPPPPPEKPPELPREIQPSVAETMIETTEIPPPVSPSVPGRVQESSGPAAEQYLSQSKITVLPVLPEAEIARATVYPPIAQRSGIEGVVQLELFIDRQGNVQKVSILREDPPEKGFGAAAVNAFRGIRGKPAEANGTAVAVRFRYKFTFKLN